MKTIFEIILIIAIAIAIQENCFDRISNDEKIIYGD